jgi:cobalt-zinc-cadmium efflux system outer membrane protein
MINVQVSAPIPVSNNNWGNISAANADYMQAVENVKRIEQSLKSRMARVAQEYQSSLAAVSKYENEIIPQSALGLELSEEAYQAGELDFLQVLILRRTYFESMIRLIESKSQLAQAAAKIDGLLLTGGLDAPQDYTVGDGLRGDSFGGQ